MKVQMPVGIIGIRGTRVAGRADVLPARYLEALPIAVTAMLAATSLAGLHGRAHFGRAPRLADAARAAALSLAILSTAALLYWRQFQYSRLTIACQLAMSE